MKFKVDQNLPIEVVQLLGQAGYDTATVLDQELGGVKDANLARSYRQENRAGVTLDLDFADIRSYPPQEYAGIIVLRPKQQDKLQVVQLFERLLKALQREKLEHALWIVDEQRIRIRE